MVTLRWDRYPFVMRTEPARTWLQMQHQLQLAPKTLDAYGRSLNDYLAFCDRTATPPETAARDHLARYVADLTTRPCPIRQSAQPDQTRRGLDPVIEEAVLRELDQFTRGKTAIFISHRLNLARLADRVVVLDEGRIAEEGKIETLLCGDGWFAAAYRDQVGLSSDRSAIRMAQGVSDDA